MGTGATPMSDLQSRLRYIQEQCTKMERNEYCDFDDIAKLAGFVDYLAKILEKHLAENER